MPVLEITQAADVGMGSFYNHFDSKEQLFEAAVAEVLDAHGALLDHLTASIDDPAETFACSFRLTGRLFRRRPQESQILLANGMALLSSDSASRRAHCATSRPASRAGRFTVDDPELALSVAGGALLGLGNLLRDQPDRDDAAPPTPSPRTFCGCSGCPPTRRTKSAGDPCLTWTGFDLPDSAAGAQRPF